MTIEQVKDLFGDKYDALKLEFYNKSHKDMAGSAKDEQLGNQLLISELATVTADIDIPLKPEMTVTDLEMAFEKNGLHVQVFRWSNNLWLQTISSDHLSLQAQNRKGQESIVE